MPEHWVLTALKWLLAGAVAFWVGLPVAVQLLVVLSGADLLSCLVTERSSFRHTLRRISVTFLYCATIYIAFGLAKDLSGLKFDVGTVGAAVTLFYFLGELIEVTLNCSTVIDIPPAFVSWLEKAQRGMSGKQRRALADLKEHEPSNSD